VKPLTVKKGQYARLWVSVNVPKGSPLAPGAFAGTATLSGNFGRSSANLSGEYLGPLIGEVVVAPVTAAPGQPVLVQVCDAQGKPVTDPRVIVTIQGVPAASRYLQYVAPGKRTLAIRASRGASSESAEVAVTIQGVPTMFRESLGALPLMSMPIISAARLHGQPYAATLRLGNSRAVRRIRAAEIAKAAAEHGAATSAALAHASAAPAGGAATAAPAIVVPPATAVLRTLRSAPIAACPTALGGTGGPTPRGSAGSSRSTSAQVVIALVLTSDAHCPQDRRDLSTATCYRWQRKGLLDQSGIRCGQVPAWRLWKSCRQAGRIEKCQRGTLGSDRSECRSRCAGGRDPQGTQG
jgi:hypothetical protein